jgi:hypothetical protein
MRRLPALLVPYRPACAMPPPSAALTRLPRAADNDNEDADAALLPAALRLLDQHGWQATAFAYQRAEHAFFAGERSAYRWWLAVARTLDRRIAACH